MGSSYLRGKLLLQNQKESLEKKTKVSLAKEIPIVFLNSAETTHVKKSEHDETYDCLGGKTTLMQIR